MKKNVICVIGTRPEAIKMAPIINLLKKEEEVAARVLSTAQHREMLDQVLHLFHVVPDIDLDIMLPNQSLTKLTSRLMGPLEEALQKEKPEIVLAQGDTTTAFLVGLCCFYQQIPFFHVEAGLRSGSFTDPYPEEMNRSLISRLSAFHYAPTESAKQNLLREGYPELAIRVTGNTVIDALDDILSRKAEPIPGIDPQKKLVLLTAHRRETFGSKFHRICRAVKTLAEQNRQLQFLYPVHPNPQVSEPALAILGGIPNILLSHPLPYEQFVMAMKASYLILSDSGGVQEEAPALGTPVMVLRDTTERPEGIELGACRLIGTDYDRIVSEVEAFIRDPHLREKMVVGRSLYGDGRAAERIVEHIRETLLR